MVATKPANLVFLKELAEAGRLELVTDRRDPSEQSAKAHRYVDQGHSKRNVVITVMHQGQAR